MSIFGNIWSRISGKRDDKAAAGGARPGGAAAGGAPSFSNVSGSSASTAPAAPTPSAPAAPVDVEAIMMELERKSGHKSNWRVSIVDLMSLLGMDNSLAERKELAKELGYTGDMNDSATMNMWLHKQVMRKMAENGGKVPANMLD
jgi:hypothetical protein